MNIFIEHPPERVVSNQYEVLFHRHPGNPILTGKDWPYSMNSVFNAGATRLPDGSTLLLCRVEDRRGLPICVRLVPRTASMGGGSIPNQH